MTNTARVIIYYFSQTRATEKLSQKIAEGLISSGMEVIFRPILSDTTPDIKDFDIIGIGCPVYVFRPPFPVTDFIKSLPDMRKKYFFTYISFGTNPGACGNRIRTAMKKKHAVDLGCLATRGEDYFIGYLRKGYLFSPGYPGDFGLQTAAEFGLQIAHRFKNGYPGPEPYDPPTHFIYAMERFSFNRLHAKLFLSKAFRVSRECDGCGICIKKCPVGNLTGDKNKRPVWGNRCILCATCEFTCPQDAIRSPYDWAIMAPFLNYNIRKAKSENTPYAKVKFGKARMVRL
jgi:ferredoxin/flavodoxin